MSFARQTIRGRCQGHDNRPSTAPTPHCPPGSGRTIRVLIKTTNGRVVAVEPNSTDSVARLKELVGAKAGGGRDQSLTFEGRELVDRKTLDQYNIKIGSRLMQQPGICAQGSSPTKQHNRRPYSASASSGESTPRPAWGAGQGGTKKTKKTKGLGSGRLTPSRTKAATVDESLFGMTGIVAGSSGAGAGAGTDTQATASGSNSPAAWPTTQRTNRTPRATRSRTTRPATTAGTGRGRFSNASSRPPSSAGSSYRRPSSVASSRASTARGSRPNSSSSSRSTLNPGNPQVKAKAYVDETLFGAPSVLSAEELHKQMWAGSKPFWKATEVVDTGPKRPKARKSTRCDFDAPVELPSGPAGDGRRFAKTSTLNGGYDAPRHARPAANKPSSIGRSLIAHKPQRQSRQPSGSSKPIRSPFIHSNNKFEATAKPAARMNNTIWANMPNT